MIQHLIIDYPFEGIEIPDQFLNGVKTVVRNLSREFGFTFHENYTKGNTWEGFNTTSKEVSIRIDSSSYNKFYKLILTIQQDSLPSSLTEESLTARILNDFQEYFKILPFDQIIKEVRKYLHEESRYLEKLFLVSRNTSNVNSEIIAILEEALNSGNPDFRADVGWRIIGNEHLYSFYLPLIQKRLAIENEENVKIQMEEIISTINDLLEIDREAMAPDGLDRIIFDIENRRSLTDEEKISLTKAIAFLNMPYDLEIWYSERCPKLGHKTVLECLHEFENWKYEIEKSFKSRKVYNFGFSQYSSGNVHPLGAYIISSQFLWHYYKKPEAEMHLLQSLNLAKTLMSGEHPETPVIPQLLLTDLYNSFSLMWLYENPHVYHLNYFYLGELFEARKDFQSALDYYIRFVEEEPSFSPRNSFAIPSGSWDYYDCNHFFPGTVEALKRIGTIHKQEFNDIETAKAYYQKALNLNHSHHTPFLELASILRDEGNVKDALILEEKYFLTLISYPDPQKNLSSVCLPFEPGTLMMNYKHWIENRKPPEKIVHNTLIPIIEFLNKIMNEEPFKNAYASYFSDPITEELSTVLVNSYNIELIKSEENGFKRVSVII